MIQFNSLNDVEKWARSHGVAQLRALVLGVKLDTISMQFARSWLHRVESVMRVLDSHDARPRSQT